MQMDGCFILSKSKITNSSTAISMLFAQNWSVAVFHDFICDIAVFAEFFFCDITVFRTPQCPPL